VSVSTDELQGDPLYRPKSFLRVATGRGRDPLEEIEALAPDVVHVHNLFPNYGRRWVEQLRVPFVATLHNFRPICAKATLFRDGELCTSCPDGDRWAGLRYACYADSRLATLPLTWANRHGPPADPVLSRARRLVVLSERARAVFSASGIGGRSFVVGPNFLPAALDPGATPETSSRGWLYVGRFSPEKGIVPLLQAWPRDHRLTVVGDGPEALTVRELARGRDVEVVGALPRADVLTLMRDRVGLVLPSLGLEGPPLVYVEALAAGLPVLAFGTSLVADVVTDEGTGARAEWQRPLAEVLEQAEDRFPDLRAVCRSSFEERYSEQAYIDGTRELYDRVLAEAAT